MTRFLAVVGALGLAAGGFAADPDPSVLAAQLGSPDYREREAAAAALERAGPRAIPALREAVKASEPEVRLRAAPILYKLQRAARSTGLLAPKRITLSYKNVPLGAAVGDFRTRTGLNVVLDSDRIADPLRTVTVATGELPVWEALDAFCAAAGLRETFAPEIELPKSQPSVRRSYLMPPQPPGPESAPIVLSDGTGRVPGVRDSAVRVLVMPRSFPGHRVTLGTGDTTLCLDVAPAPGLNWQHVAAVKVTKLIDDSGRFGGGGAGKPDEDDLSDFDGIVVLGGGPGLGFRPRFGGYAAPTPAGSVPNPRIVPVPLKIATPHARSLRRLEGLVLGEVTLTNQTLVTVTDPTKHLGKTFDGPGQVSFTVTSVVTGKDGTTVRFTLRHPSPWAVGARRGLNPGGLWPEPPRGADQTPVVGAYDAAGKPMQVQSASTQGGASDDGQTLVTSRTWTFDPKAGVPARLVVVGPRPVIVEVPFALENVPLP